MGKKVVVIEDDPKNMKLFKAILTKMKHIDLKTEAHGARGLALIKTEEPDLIILDIKLPGLSGIEICKKLRELERFQDVPIIAVTAYAMIRDKKRILEAGFNEYITKPISIGEFRSVVKKYL